jgi:hypothetical protein
MQPGATTNSTSVFTPRVFTCGHYSTKEVKAGNGYKH